MRSKAIWGVGLVPVCILALVAASPAPRTPTTGTAVMGLFTPSEVVNLHASYGERDVDVGVDHGVQLVIGVSPDESIARNLRAAMELEAQAVAALRAARVREDAASALLLDERGAGTGGDPSHVHALNRLGQATQWARLAESSLERSLDDLAAALAVLPVTSPIASIVLGPSPLYLTSCHDTFALTATALDMSGTPVNGETILFQFVDTGPGGVVGLFDPPTAVTDASGNVTTTILFIQSTCVPNCTSGLDCSAQIRASDQDGLVLSNVVQIIDAIP